MPQYACHGSMLFRKHCEEEGWRCVKVCAPNHVQRIKELRFSI